MNRRLVIAVAIAVGLLLVLVAGKTIGLAPVAALAGGACVLAAAAGLSRIFEEEPQQEKKKKAFYGVLTEAFRGDSLNTYDDLMNLYKGVRGLGAEALAARTGVASWLREYIVDVYNNKSLYFLKPDELKVLMEKIGGFIKTVESESPYADLPPVERSIITDVVGFIEADDKGSAVRKIKEMATAIQIRADAVSKLERTRRWSVPVAIVGIIVTACSIAVTVFFSVQKLTGP